MVAVVHVLDQVCPEWFETLAREIDVAISYGHALQRPGIEVIPLGKERIAALCSPTLKDPRRPWKEAMTEAALEQLLINSRLAARGHRPVCQDTGVGQVFLRVGCEVSFYRRDGPPARSMQAVADEGVRRAYRDPVNPLRATMIADPLGQRINTRDNTPAVVHCEIVEGDELEVLVVAKGGGRRVQLSRCRTRFRLLAHNQAWHETSQGNGAIAARDEFG